MAAQRLATEQDAYNKGKIGTPTSKKLCTATRASALGCTCGSYSGERIVPVSALAAKLPTYTLTFTNNYTSMDADYINVAFFEKNDVSYVEPDNTHEYQIFCEVYSSNQTTKTLTFDTTGITVNKALGGITTASLGEFVNIFYLLIKNGYANGKWTYVDSMELIAANQSITYYL